jgi:hypothetical protein
MDRLAAIALSAALSGCEPAAAAVQSQPCFVVLVLTYESTDGARSWTTTQLRAGRWSSFNDLKVCKVEI